MMGRVSGYFLKCSDRSRASPMRKEVSEIMFQYIWNNWHYWLHLWCHIFSALVVSMPLWIVTNEHFWAATPWGWCFFKESLVILWGCWTRSSFLLRKMCLQANIFTSIQSAIKGRLSSARLFKSFNSFKAFCFVVSRDLTTLPRRLLFQTAHQGDTYRINKQCRYLYALS